MALYIRIYVNDDPVAIYGVTRQEPLEDEEKEYTYHASKYTELDNGFCRSKDYKVIKHKYSNKAEVLAEKVLNAFNN